MIELDKKAFMDVKCSKGYFLLTLMVTNCTG